MSNTKYSGTVIIINEEGNIVHQRELAADDIIDELLLRSIVCSENTVYDQKKEVVRGGGYPAPVKMASRIAKAGKKPAKPKEEKSTEVQSMTERVAELANKGMTNAEISESLGITITNVSATKSNAKKKGLLTAPSKTEERQVKIKKVDAALSAYDPLIVKAVKDFSSMGWNYQAIAEECDLNLDDVKKICSTRKKAEISLE